MVIQPITVFKLISGVPFDNTKKHTIWFKNPSQQLTYFNTKTIRSFTDFTYVRQSGFVVRVPIKADAIYECNYCMFQNAGYGNKWFYAFITGIEYVNNEVSAVSFEIDYIQTWLFEMSFDESYIEREHVDSDEIGEHTILEPIDYGENVAQDYHDYYFDEWKVFIQAIPNTSEDAKGEADGVIYKGIYSGANIYKCNLVASEINGAINNLIANGYTITNVYMLPNVFSDIGEIYIGNGEVGSRPTKYKQPAISEREYVPKNNKLFTFPYTYMHVLNNQGSAVDFKWENFNLDASYSFQIAKNYLNGGSCQLLPVAYETGSNREYELMLTDFPQCVWNESAFMSYLGSKGIGRMISNLSLGGTEPSLSNLITNIGGLVNLSANSLGAVGQVSKPKLYKGNGSSSYIDVSYNRFGFTFLTMGIKPEMAKVVDDFLTRYGYQVNVIKEPNLTSRKAFNFIKTKDCNVKGNLPNTAKESISNTFNSGITLWHSLDVGNYTQDNSIV